MGDRDTATAERPEAEPTVEAHDVEVRYRTGQRDSFRSFVLESLKRGRRRSAVIEALKGVSLDAFAGEVVGIIGANGAGKTTLCAVIGRMIRPDTGSVDVRGEVSALLSMGTGFNADLSGRENVFLNGLMLGFSRREIQRRFDEIVAFAGLERFIDSPVKHYSSGMKSRLGFSIASRLNPEILVLDEALGGGDLEFGGRAAARMREIVAGAKTVVVVTHALGFVRTTCNRAFWLDQGVVCLVGDPNEVVDAYEASIPPRPKKRVLTPEYEAPDAAVTDRVIASLRNVDIRFRLKRERFYALRGVSFDVHEGEILGVIGANGAGKTTLCRVLSRIYLPDGGSAWFAEDRVSTLLSMGVGMSPNLTVADNVLLNGMTLGMARRRMLRQTDKILKFAELTAYRDRPVKTLSSGMKSRLGFSIAMAANPSLLLVDEALSAGDLSFKARAEEAMDAMIRKADAVVVVSHNLTFVTKVCTRAIWIDRGVLEYDGEPAEAVNRYRARIAERNER